MTAMPGKRANFRAVLIGLLCALSSIEPGAAEAESLARLVPDTAGLCIEIHDLAGAVARLQGGKLAARAGKNPAIRAKLAAPLAAVRGALAAQLGITAQQFAVLFGGQTLVAVWPEKSPGDAGPGLLILRCTDEALLRRVARHMVNRQRQAGRLAPARQLASHGQMIDVYTINTSHSGSQVCLALVGPVAIVATSATLLEEIVGAEFQQRTTQKESAAEAPAASLAALPAYQAAIERLNPSATVRVFFNPRPWDDQMRAMPRPKSGRKALVHDAISDVWKASDYLSASLEAADSLQLEAFLACHENRLSAPLREVFASLAGASRMADRLPSQCLALAVGRLDWGRMYRAVLDASAGGKYGIRAPDSLPWSAALALAGSFGPDTGLAIVAPPAARAGGEPPVDWLLGLETRAVEPGSDAPPAAAWLVPWLRETLRVSAAAARARGMPPNFRSSTVQQDGISLTGISGITQLPACPTLFLAQEQRLLWLGNSARLTAQAAGSRLPSSLGNRRYQALHNPRLGTPSDLVLLDLAEIRRVLATWPAEATGQLAGVLPLAELADATLLEIQCEAAITAISLHIGCD